MLGHKGSKVVSEVEHWMTGMGVKWLISLLEREGFLRLGDIR